MYTAQDHEDAYDAMIECALWSSLAWGPDEGHEPIPADEVHDESHIDDDKLAELRADLRAFIEDNAADIDASGLSPEQVGHDFWLTRERHGAGFWDRGLGDIGRRLTDAAHVYGGFDLGLYYRHDDNGEVIPA